MKVPGVTQPGGICNKPVDMTSVFPTLIHQCGLPQLQGLDGNDITPLLKNPSAAWKYPAISEINVGNFAVRSQDWRYIRYSDGKEELYDRKKDPNEWYNLASDPAYAKIINDHKKWLPAKVAKETAGKKQFFFDPHDYTYMNRETGEFIDGKK